MERENFQLNAENKNLKDKVKMKERDLRDMEEKVTHIQLYSLNSPHTPGCVFSKMNIHFALQEEILKGLEKFGTIFYCVGNSQ